MTNPMTPERIEEIKPYFTNEQLDELSREYRTMPTDGEGYAIEPEYEGMVARGYIVKLISDVKTARTALEEVERKHGDTGNALEIKRMLLEKANYEAGRQRVFKESAERKLAEAQQTIATLQSENERLSSLLPVLMDAMDLFKSEVELKVTIPGNEEARKMIYKWSLENPSPDFQETIGNKEGSDKA